MGETGAPRRVSSTKCGGCQLPATPPGPQDHAALAGLGTPPSGRQAGCLRPRGAGRDRLSHRHSPGAAAGPGWGVAVAPCLSPNIDPVPWEPGSRALGLRGFLLSNKINLSGRSLNKELHVLKTSKGREASTVRSWAPAAFREGRAGAPPDVLCPQTSATGVCSCPQEGLPLQLAAADFLSWVSSSAWRQLDSVGFLNHVPSSLHAEPRLAPGIPQVHLLREYRSASSPSAAALWDCS